MDTSITNQSGSEKRHLEDLVEKTAPENSAQQDEETLPLNQYIANFSTRYNGEEAFREVVHKYLGLSGFRKASLSLGKVFMQSWYKKKTDDLVQEYAKRIREDLAKAIEVKKELLELKKVAYELEHKAGDICVTTDVEQTAKQQYNGAVRSKEETIRQVEHEAQTKIKEEEERKARAYEEVKRLTDAKELARKKLKDIILSSPLIKANEDGVLNFDEQKICGRLEDVFLAEILQDVEKEDGCGFMAKITASYNGLISHYDAMEDVDELSEVEWVESMILSRTKGYKVPTFPYLVVGKPEKAGKGKTSIDTAIALDSSGSMDDNNRFVIAKKTALATSALMRKLNPKNQTYLAHFNGEVCPVTSADLIRSVRPYDGTATELALDWLLNTLSNSGLSIAYLITDGAPNRLGDTIAAAKRFRDHPNMLLRIFLIDGNKDTEDNIRKIGYAAGPATKVVPVKNYQLSGGVIRDVSKVIGEMYNIEKF